MNPTARFSRYDVISWRKKQRVKTQGSVSVISLQPFVFPQIKLKKSDLHIQTWLVADTNNHEDFGGNVQLCSYIYIPR